ncbi:hypothetical protein OH76DRAFT_882183 [Lentinus brumalis]|uniref:Uncharacterized protein n=1 Tax=Lentinus brumalis TaxID=2498619 RepID=A0A371DRT2_9APHY|nr:hypothetical protein OH76DRAFT_882183 [Polyporus brumalis]
MYDATYCAVTIDRAHKFHHLNFEDRDITRARTKGGSSEDKCIDPSEMILKFNSEMSRCRAMMTAGPTIVLSSGVCRSATLWTRSRLDSHGGKDSSSLDYRDKPCNSRRERCASDFRIPWTAPCGSRAGSVDTCPVRRAQVRRSIESAVLAMNEVRRRLSSLGDKNLIDIENR